MKRLRCHCEPLIKAIDAYLRKADDDLSDALEEEGYVEPEETVKRINRMEDAVADALTEETRHFKSAIENSVDLETFAALVWPSVKLGDPLGDTLKAVFLKQFSDFMPQLIGYYLRLTDRKLKLEQVSQRTVAWVESWSGELAGLMQLDSHEEIEGILTDGLEEGIGIAEFAQRILESGIRNERLRARRVALTEVLRAHSVAQQEAFMQSPSVKEKMWKHTGAYRNNPRQNHVDMDGKRVPVPDPFKLTGANGKTYHPMYPRDTILPAGESVSCHCLCQPVVDEDILGMSLEERQELQRKAVEEMDDAWEKELDARNKAKAGINEETVKIDWIRQKTHEGQVKYFGGGDAGEQRLALLDSGVITKDSELERLYKKNAKGVRVRKTLQELADDGIMTVSEKALEHSVNGEYIVPSKAYPNGRMKSGGHSQKAMDIMAQKGIQYHVVKTYSNGVRIGYVEGHESKLKNGKVTAKRPDADIGQSWFPSNWTDYDIRCAGTFVANRSQDSGILKFADYRGVRTGVYLDANGQPATIFPHNMAQPTADGGLEGARS